MLQDGIFKLSDNGISNLGVRKSVSKKSLVCIFQRYRYLKDDCPDLLAPWVSWLPWVSLYGRLTHWSSSSGHHPVFCGRKPSTRDRRAVLTDISPGRWSIANRDSRLSALPFPGLWSHIVLYYQGTQSHAQRFGHCAGIRGKEIGIILFDLFPGY